LAKLNKSHLATLAKDEMKDFCSLLWFLCRFVSMAKEFPWWLNIFARF
jgi:hypothetical protein